MNSTEELLTQVNLIQEKYDFFYKQTGGYFNIFQIANIARKETNICRVLHELLSPNGSHYQGDIYLKLFCKTVLKHNLTDEEFKTAKVNREYVIKNNRRIDLVIETKHHFFPIEVKIDAKDQDTQLFDYFEEAQNKLISKKSSDEAKIYYLTCSTQQPADSSKGTLKNTDIINITFEEDILKWLDLCLKHTNTINIAPIREIILQLINTIRSFTNKIGDDKTMEIINTIMQSPSTIKSALDISNVIQQAQSTMMENLFKSVENKVKQYSKLENDYDYTTQIKSFYKTSHSTFPGISYLYKTINEPNCNKEIWVRMEIEEKIFVGYCCVENNKKINNFLLETEINSILNTEPNIDKCWAYWQYIRNENALDAPDFRYYNEQYYNLYDNNEFEKFTTLCAETIKILLEN